MGKPGSFSQPWSELVSPEALGCVDLGKHSSFKEEERDVCQGARADISSWWRQRNM